MNPCYVAISKRRFRWDIEGVKVRKVIFWVHLPCLFWILKVISRKGE